MVFPVILTTVPSFSAMGKIINGKSLFFFPALSTVFCRKRERNVFVLMLFFIGRHVPPRIKEMFFTVRAEISEALA